jgi:ribonuclease T1
MRKSRKQTAPMGFAWWLVLVAVALLLGWNATSSETPQSTPVAPTSGAATGVVLPTVAPGGIATMQISALPPEALETLDLIYKGGPFPYRQDGTTFQNRERLLPIQPQGYYREYTVRTPGEDDRGARRIVFGREGEIYYTDDHYASFRRVIQ